MDICKRSDETVTPTLQSELTCESMLVFWSFVSHNTKANPMGHTKNNVKNSEVRGRPCVSAGRDHLSAEARVETLRGIADDFRSALRERETRVGPQGERAFQWFIHWFIHLTKFFIGLFISFFCFFFYIH